MKQFAKRIISHGTAILLGASSVLIALKLEEEENQIGGNVNFGKKVRDFDNRKKTLPERFVATSTLPVINPPISIYRPNPNMEIAYDARSKNPVYVMERIRLATSTEADRAADRSSKKFYEAKDLNSHHRSRNGYFHKSGFDRGHMAAAANYTSDDEMHDTFSLLNVSPQYPIMNRVIWSRLEELVRRFAREKSSTHDTIVITGPLWLPNKIVRDHAGKRRDWYQYSYYGFGWPPSIVQVPTHFFKVVLILSNSSTRAESNVEEVDSFAAFVIPNSNFIGQTSVNLKDFLVRITDLEAITGISFFPGRYEEQIEVFDLITEEVWMKEDVKFREKKIDSDQDLGGNFVMTLAGNYSSSSSQNRRAKIHKKIQEMEKRQKLPLHLCADDSCSKIIRIKQREDAW
jgi:DNA/RNA endonuclease G (NUC1)